MIGEPSWQHRSSFDVAEDSNDRFRGEHICGRNANSASRGVVTRDPSSIVQCKDEYWVFHTGRGIPTFRSKDLVKWERGPAVFQSAPEWIATNVPENRNMSYWAPDIIKVGDRYLLYYSVSSMGKMTSARGIPRPGP